MPAISYDRRIFRPLAKAEAGDADADTLFHYRQSGDLVVGTYQGGRIRHGQLIAIADGEGRLDMRYQHVTADGRLMTGVCRSAPEQLPDGRLRLRETWRWTGGAEGEGASILEELVLPPAEEEIDL